MEEAGLAQAAPPGGTACATNGGELGSLGLRGSVIPRHKLKPVRT